MKWPEDLYKQIYNDIIMKAIVVYTEEDRDLNNVEEYVNPQDLMSCVSLAGELLKNLGYFLGETIISYLTTEIFPFLLKCEDMQTKR